MVSDIHSNQSALEAVLEDAEKHGRYDLKLCPGDVVGYGPNPNEVIKILKREGFITVLGNHDRVVRGGSAKNFNPDALSAAMYNASILSDESRAFLERLSNVPYIDPQGRFAMVHGSFDGIAKKIDGRGKLFEDIYVRERGDFPGIPDNAKGDEIILGILGHTHIPTYAHYFMTEDDMRYGREVCIKFHRLMASDVSGLEPLVINLDFGATPLPKAIFNPGSVGQPRNDSNRAAYGIAAIDGRDITLEFRSVKYDIAETQRRMQAIGLTPEKGGFTNWLVQRLEHGK